MIFNHLTGLDLGPPPTYLIPGNMAVADAPTRYPFLWNAGLQDHTQWGGFAANGNDALALARNLGQALGVFAMFHPEPKSPRTPFDRDYLAVNSVDIAGLAAAEGELARIGPPAWPFAIDRALAERGKDVFDRPLSQGGCVSCHGVREGDPRPSSAHTWRTTSWDVGTDLHQWDVLLRMAKTGRLEGAIVPGETQPLGARDLAFNILKAAVIGTLAQTQAAQTKAAQAGAPAMHVSMSAADFDMMRHVPAMSSKPMESGLSFPGTNVYEARVLRGIWAAAPYLHNGSVPSLAALLMSARDRPSSFAIGPIYDVAAIGLATAQAAGTFVLKTTGCEDRKSGDSNCGHDYGTALPADEKQALLEYMKTL